MNEKDLDERMKVAVEAIREGGKAALDFFRRRDDLTIEAKGVQDLVSQADREVETIIRQRIARSFPDDMVLGEEHGGALASELWITDPIDGTANFLRGMPYWSMVLAFIVDEKTELALTYDPVHDELFTARRGKGAERNGKPVRVSTRTDPSTACIGLSYTFKTAAERYERLMHNILALKLDHRRLGSSALSLCHVADGRLDAHAVLTCSSWDVIAGLAIVQEAGGRATDYTDGASLLDTRAVAAATPSIADIIAEATGIKL
jgi:myo-inositol-1(or 4)-monophosphatase